MASENKKRKAKNSYLWNGGEKYKEGHMKRVFYFTKAQRHKNKRELREECISYS